MKKGIAFLFAAVVMAVAFIACGDEEVESVLKFSETELTVDSDGGSLLVGVTSNMSWNVVSDADWCVLENYSNSGNGSVIIKVSANLSTTDREAKLTVSGGSLKLEAIVRQSGVELGNKEELPNENVSGNENDTLIEPLDKSLGKLNGKFSVSATKQISFSKGNLQYQASTNTWRFAENQYDVIGNDNKNISATYDGWIDLFGWGTSGYNGKYPYMTSTNSSDYFNGFNDIAGTNYDWGVYNAISNGGNKAGMWRTPSIYEWSYLFSTRVNAKNLRGQATVNGQAGYILLPDGWSTPSGLTFSANPDCFTTNRYSVSDWNKMEAAGAVFLPCTGCDRIGTTMIESMIDKDDWGGNYWTSKIMNGSNAYCFTIYENRTESYNGAGLYGGLSVRLVQD